MTPNIAPQWQVTALDGESQPQVTDYHGKPTLLLFFNLGCLGCMSRALPLANDIARAYPDLHVVGIHTNFEGMPYTRQQVQAEIEQRDLVFPVMMDKQHTTYDVYQAGGTPHWVLLNQQGEIEKSIFGSLPNAQQRLTYGMIELFGY